MPKNKPDAAEESSGVGFDSYGNLKPAAQDLRAVIDAALHEIDTVTAAQWANEQFNAGAHAAAEVVRRHLGEA